MRKLRIATLLLLAGLLAAHACYAQANDVPRSSWAYKAVQDLVNEGLVKGYPPEGNFFGNRTVTRYEMATIVQRVVARMDQLIHERNYPQHSIGKKQIQEIKRLVAEFRTELTVIGTNMTRVQKDLAAVKADVARLNRRVGRITTNLMAVKRTAHRAEVTAEASQKTSQENRKRIGSIEHQLPTKVNAGYGTITIGGLFQTWIQATTSSIPNAGVDSFRIRRAEIHIFGNINPRVYWFFNIDPSKQLAINSNNTINQSTTPLQDLYVGYNMAKHWQVEVGQEHVPLSYEGFMTGSGSLLTVERTIFNLLPLNDGRVGDVRDIGVTIRSDYPTWNMQLAVMNDGGNLQNTTDNNNAKEIMYNLGYKGLRNTYLGVYQEISGGINGPAKDLRQRLGGELVFHDGPHTVEAEFVHTRDDAPNIVFGPTPMKGEGGYLTYAYQFNPHWQFVVRGDLWNPNTELHNSLTSSTGIERDLTLGANYFIDGNHAKIQFNWVRKDIDSGAPSYLGVSRSLFLTNFQTAW